MPFDASPGVVQSTHNLCRKGQFPYPHMEFISKWIFTQGENAMYYVMLEPGNSDFVDGVTRAFPRFRSKRLDAVITALDAAQRNHTAPTLRTLLTGMDTWSNQDPKEFANRGGTKGVAYRLWMEAKQALKDNFNQNFPGNNPQPPQNCPGTTLLGVYVPEGEGQMEICHGFAYRWAVAAGKIPEDLVITARRGTTYNGTNMMRVLYPGGYNTLLPARVGGMMQLQAGDIIALFTPPIHRGQGPALAHSLIAKTATTWFSANNAGTFGVGTGRTEINTTQNFGHGCGWLGNDDQFRTVTGNVAHVVYRRIP